MENDFIQDIKKNNFLSSNIYPEFNNIFNLYYSKYKENINSINSKKYLFYFLNIVYCLLVFYILIGWMSPYQLLVYYIIFSTIFLIIFENKYNYSPLQLIVKYFFNKNFEMIPISYHIFKKTIIIFILISFIGLIKKEYSVFSFLSKIITNLSKYH